MADTILNLNLNINPPETTTDDHHDFKESTVLKEELNRSRSENKKLTEMLIFLWESCSNHPLKGGQYVDNLFSENTNSDSKSSKKRKREGDEGGFGAENNGNTTSTSHDRISMRSCSHEYHIGGGGNPWERPREFTRNNVSKVYVSTHPSDTTLVVKDGYQWRKYGQKVTRDNPSPRAYYKCSFAPNCPVKKKVQRSVEDPSLLVAIYEGEHNHLHPNCEGEVALGFNQIGRIPCSISTPNYTKTSSPSPNPNPDPSPMVDSIGPGIDMPAFQQLLVEKMADSLTRNPSFTASLAAAISTRILDHDLLES